MAPKDMLGGVGILPFQDPLTLGWLRYHGGEGPCFPMPTHLDSQTLSLEGDTLLKKKNDIFIFTFQNLCCLLAVHLS